jgi:transposase
MRFVPIKSEEQQAACMLMSVRDRLVGVKTQLSNAIRSYAAEFGIVGAAGRQNVKALIERILDDTHLWQQAAAPGARIESDAVLWQTAIAQHSCVN